MDTMHIEYRPPAELIPYAGNARSHSPEQIRQIAHSIQRFGFMNPLLVDAQGWIIAGHGRLLAALELGLPRVPVIRFDHLSQAQRRAYALADNKIALNAGWDPQLLKVELEFLMQADLDFDVDLTGFSTPEIDLVLGSGETPADEPPLPPLPDSADTVSRVGDLWLLGRHRVICGDSRDGAVIASLMQGESARMVITDPPYNVKIDGHVGGLGQHHHPEFAMASGEMSAEEFTAFLTASVGAAAAACLDGALLYLFMDWRHLPELLAACQSLGLQQLNLCVWVKSNGGMGSLYRSQHELVLVVKKGQAPHLNQVQLGKHGRYRTNVWTYPGMNAFGQGRDAALAVHPTVKPVALVQDAILDVTRHGDIVFDGFLGSGTTVLAAHKCRRRCYGVELDPRYVDVVLRRWMDLSGEQPVHATGASLAQLQAARRPVAA